MSNTDETLSKDALDALLAEIAQGESDLTAEPEAETPPDGDGTAAATPNIDASARATAAPKPAMTPGQSSTPPPATTPLNLVSFEDEFAGSYDAIEGFDRVQDIPLEITVELGRTRLLIRDILELGVGSIVELEKMAGEPVDLLANGLLIARGEVVVIEDNFGVRVTEIITAAERSEVAKGETQAHG